MDKKRVNKKNNTKETINNPIIAMEKKEMLYEGKAKQVYATDDENLVIIH